SSRSRARRRRTSRSRTARSPERLRSARRSCSRFGRRSPMPSPSRESRDSDLAMIKLYHAPLTRSVRILWLLEDLRLPHQLERVACQPPKTPCSQKSRYGKVPAMEDGALAMCESGAILEYILERYGDGRLAPAPGTAERGLFLQWVHFAEATALPPL